MKKTYEAPKVEKMEFNYSEAVVASDNCHNVTVQSYSQVDHCSATEDDYFWVGDKH